MQRPYNKLKEAFADINQINNILSILRWDSAVIMPRGSIDSRSQQIEFLSALAHEKIADSKIGDLIEQTDETNLGDWDRKNFELMKKDYFLQKLVPVDLTKALAVATTKSEMIWRKAKNENNFKLFAPHLKEVLNLTKQVANIKAEHLNLSIYDAMLDSYEPNFKSADIDNIFNDLKIFLPELIDKVIAHQSSRAKDLKTELPVETQKNIGLELMKLMGFNFDKGRLDISEHPFCGGITEDLRLTTRYNKDNYISGIMGIIHETGHALYQQNLPLEWINQPIGSPVGMATHESQSLIWEYRVGRSKKFIEFFTKFCVEKFNLPAGEFDSENLYKEINKVSRSFIRVDADEVTYPAHIIMRYDIEKMLICEDLDVNDLPEVWNNKMQEVLGIKPSNDKEGCLQDIHWPMGAFGYFPFYLIGAISATQLYNSFDKNNNFDFATLKDWLNENVYKQASRYSLQELLHKATGSTLSPNLYKEYLQEKFLDT